MKKYCQVIRVIAHTQVSTRWCAQEGFACCLLSMEVSSGALTIRCRVFGRLLPSESVLSS